MRREIIVLIVHGVPRPEKHTRLSMPAWEKVADPFFNSPTQRVSAQGGRMIGRPGPAFPAILRAKVMQPIEDIVPAQPKLLGRDDRREGISRYNARAGVNPTGLAIVTAGDGLELKIKPRAFHGVVGLSQR